MRGINNLNCVGSIEVKKNIDVSYNLFPFVFWVSILISVLVREYIWILSLPFSYIGRKVRISDVLIISLDSLRAKGYINIQNISIELQEKDKYDLEKLLIKPENEVHLRKYEVVAIGTLGLKSPKNFYNGFVLSEDEIKLISTPEDKAQRMRIKIDEATESIKRRFGFILGSSFFEREANLIQGMIMGNNGRMDRSFYNQLRQAGLVHLVAVSGYNISIVLGTMSIVRILVFNKRWIYICLILIFTFLYILSVGTQPSVIRAGIMGVSGLLAMEAGSGRSIKRIFFLTVLVMLWIWPSWLWDVGWELSAAATWGLIYGEPFLKKFFGFLPGIIKEGWCASLSATIATMPIIIWRFGGENVSRSGLLVNIPAGLLVPSIMALGILVIVAGLLYLPAGRGVAILGRPVILAMVKIIEWGAYINSKLQIAQ